MDGINGISGSQAAIAGAFLAVVADEIDVPTRWRWPGWAVCGASLGFLPFNAVRARIFLGDVGSYFLGFWLAGLALLVVDAGAPAIVVRRSVPALPARHVDGARAAGASW